MAKSRGGIEPRKGMIRNSTADFLLFTQQSGEQSIEVRLYNETVWLTQRAMSVLYDVDRTVVTKHLRNIFEEGELSQDQVSARFAHTAAESIKKMRTFAEYWSQYINRSPVTTELLADAKCSSVTSEDESSFCRICRARFLQTDGSFYLSNA